MSIEVASFKLATDALVKLSGALLEVSQNTKDEFSEISDNFTDPEELAKFYVQPDCQQFSPADDDYETSGILRQNAFEAIEQFIGGYKKDGNHQLFILSDAGMGKTSLLVMLKLLYLTSFWPKKYKCVLLKLGNDTFSELESIKGGNDIVLLLDALDEDPLAFGRTQDRIEEILSVSDRFKRVIITCRTQYFSAGDDPFNKRGRVELSGRLCPVIYNSLFNMEQVDLYLTKRFKGKAQSSEYICRGKGIIEKMRSLRMRPMLLSHIEDFIDSEEKEWTDYTVYNTLIQAWLLREFRRPWNQSSYKPSVEELLNGCRYLAIHLNKKKSRTIDEESFKRLMLEYPETKHIQFMDFGGRSLVNKDSDGNYRFSHYSIQEFLHVDSVVNKFGHIRNFEINPTDLMSKFFLSWLSHAPSGRLKGIPLNKYDLSGIDLSGKVLSGLDFSTVNISKADLSGADLRNANFTLSKMVEVNLQGALLDGARFWRADLSNASLTGSSARGVNFDGASLVNANLCKTDVRDSSFVSSYMNSVLYDENTQLPELSEMRIRTMVRFEKFD